MRLLRHLLLLVAAMGIAACTTEAAPGDGPLEPEVRAKLEALFDEPHFLSAGDLEALGDSDDLRVAWPLVDLLRFHQGGERAPDLVDALEHLTGEARGNDWVGYTDALLADDVPAPPGYFEWKRALFVAVDESWAPFFDADADLDWREVTWGGVFRDGIPALEDPAVVPAEEGDWLPDDDIVFGVVAGGEARAYPLRVLEVHEIANDAFGTQRISLTYCTLCGSAIVYAAEGMTEPGQEAGAGDVARFRTSGLLQRSNKLMYDEATESLFDQFVGIGVAGPLRGVQLEMLPLSVTTWEAWRDEHPDTSILAADAGTGRVYDADPLDGRDRDGPIFPVGERDGRLAEQDRVLGVIAPTGQAVAFPVEEARAALEAGNDVELAGVALRLEAGAPVAEASPGGPDLPAHESFWFAWSQFHPGTLLWERETGHA